MYHTTVRISDPVEFTINDVLYCFEGDLDVGFTWVDFGIGRYEYGSQVCYHESWGAEEVVVEDVSMNDVFVDVEGDDWDAIPEAEWKDLKPLVLRALNEIAFDYDSPLNNRLREACEPGEPDDY